MFKFQDKKNKVIVFSLSLVILVILVAVLYYFKFRSGYYAVFLNNGAVYFGKVSFFPKLKIEDAVFVQIDEQTRQLSLERFKRAFWNPKGPIYLNKNAVTFIAPIDPNSDFARTLKEGQFGQPARSPFQPTPLAPSTNQTQTVEDKSNQFPADQQIPSER